MDKLLEVSDLAVEFLLSLLAEPGFLLLFLLGAALVQWLVLRCTRRRWQALRWVTLLPMTAIFLLGSPLLLLFFWSLPGLSGEGLEILAALAFSLASLSGLFYFFLLALVYLAGWGVGWLAFRLEERVRGQI